MRQILVALPSLAVLVIQVTSCQILPQRLADRDVQRLTSERRQYSWPRWSPDGNQIVYQVNPGPSESQIFVMNSNGSGITRITDTGKSDSTPDWSPDGRKIVFSSNRTGVGQLYLMEKDGGNVSQLTDGLQSAWCPKWSPDGKRIAFCKSLTKHLDDSQIFLMSVNEKDVVQLTNYPLGGISRFEWSPDSSLIVFEGSRIDLKRSGTPLGQYGPFLYVINVDGSGLREIEQSSGNASPTWSPDGKWILYTFFNINAQNLITNGFYVIGLGSSERRFLFEEGCDFPNWSRANNKVVFTCGLLYDGSIRTMDMKNLVR